MLKIYNTLSKQKEVFHPIDPEKIGMYVCGMTVYDYCHMGHARVLVMFDVITRHLRRQFPSVTYVRNITDIDDKIIARAIENGEDIYSLTNRFIDAMHEDERALGILPPDIEPRATDAMDQMFYMIKTLIEKGIAYQAKNGDVYYSVRKFSGYGQLSGKNLDDLEAGARVDIDSDKKDPLDFVLWKMAKPSEPSWTSPWGDGRPGWHIECSAMSTHHLGKHFDIHGGGMDLSFPHHENEIAQSRCANDTKVFANYWLHNAFITMSNEKMAKSQGNILKIKDFRDKVSGQVLRLTLISAHYKQPLDWNDKLLEDCQNTIDKWYNVYLPSNKDVNDEIIQPLYDDMNTPGYIANLHKLYEKANKGNDDDKKIFNSACNFIGLLQETKEEWLNYKKDKADISEEEIESKIELRNKARADKDYKEADNIRNYLFDKGVLIEDKDGKTIWKFK